MRLLLALLLAGIPCSAAENHFRFAILGDRTGSPQDGVYEQAWREVIDTRPDFVINVGDTINSQTEAAATAEWAMLKKLWGNKPPQFFTPGNHDIFSPAARRLYERETGRPSNYSFDWKGAHFTVLDNSGSLELPADQLDFLERDLEQHREQNPKFVFFHQPFWIVPIKLGNGEFRLHQLALKYGVRYVISGHVHVLMRMERDGVQYVAVGSSGAHLRNQGPEAFAQGSFFHFLEGRVEGGKVTLIIRELGPPAGQGRTFPLENWQR